MGNSFRKFMSAAKREGKETSEAATILLKLIRDKDSVSERDINFLKAQSKDLAKRKLNNCLNNPGQDYKGKIKSEIIRVFVIITENNMSAMEIELIEGT